MPLSARQIDRLGERINTGPLTEDDRRLLLQFRASFLPAYVEVIAKIREGLGIDPSGRPEKTPESIVAKLQRSGVRHLADMQDIAGCRIVVEGRSLQDEVVERLVHLFPEARVVDRRKRPSHGYRAVHLIVRAQGRQVEVQVRTTLQDAWAGAVEGLTDSLSVDFKHGQEKPGEKWLEWLKLAADGLDRLEREEVNLEKLGQPAAVIAGGELVGYRRGQFGAIMMLVPYIRELGR